MILACRSCGAKNRVPTARLRERAVCGECKAALTPVDRPVTVHEAAELDDLVARAPLPVLVDFWAEWCGPCRAVAPELAAIAKQKAGGLLVAKVDTEALPDLAARYTIRSIPTMLLFVSGRESRRISGAMPAAAIAEQLRI